MADAGGGRSAATSWSRLRLMRQPLMIYTPGELDAISPPEVSELYRAADRRRGMVVGETEDDRRLEGIIDALR